MRYAHKLYRGGISTFGEALRLSWAITRSQIFRQHTRIRGTSFHQGALEVLSSIRSPNSFKLTVHEEPNNQYDPNALSIYAEVSINNKRYNLKLGYLSKNIAAKAKQFLIKGSRIQILDSCVTGTGRINGYLGINLTYVIVGDTPR